MNSIASDAIAAPAQGTQEKPAARVSVPLVDLRIQHRRVADEVGSRIAEVMESASFILGPHVERFEREYAQFCDVAHCVGVGNGTDAIELALRGAEIGPGDEVVIPANTFVATAEAVVRTGARLVLADCGEDFLLDPESVAARVTARTRAVVAVDLYGQIADMESIQEAAGDGVLLVEDAAQSQGATRWSKRAGSFGVAAATSFYPGKNLGAYGDAGAVLTADDAVADRVRAIRNHGGERRYEHRQVGMNSRLDALQAAVLSVKLQRLVAWNAERVAAAHYYRDRLEAVLGVVLPQVLPGNDHVWHLFVVRVNDRDRIVAELAAAGIGAGIHYPAPVHRIPAFASYDFGVRSFPVADELADEILSLPLYPGITTDDQDRVVEALVRALA